MDDVGLQCALLNASTELVAAFIHEIWRVHGCDLLLW